MIRRLPWGLLSILAVWYALSWTRAADPLVLPNPFDVLDEFAKTTVSGVLPRHAAATLYRLVIGFMIGSLIGIPIGLLMGYSTRIYNALEAIVEVCRAIPVIALFPLFLVIFGLGDKSKFTLAAWSSSLIVLINTMYGVQHGSQVRRMVARSLQATDWQIFWNVVFPDALPEIVVGLRTGVSIALIVVLMSEMFLGTYTGLGQMIYNSQVIYDIPAMYVGIISAGLLGFAINMLLVALQRRVVHWREI